MLAIRQAAHGSTGYGPRLSTKNWNYRRISVVHLAEQKTRHIGSVGSKKSSVDGRTRRRGLLRPANVSSGGHTSLAIGEASNGHTAGLRGLLGHQPSIERAFDGRTVRSVVAVEAPDVLAGHEFVDRLLDEWRPAWQARAACRGLGPACSSSRAPATSNRPPRRTCGRSFALVRLAPVDPAGT